MLSPLLLLLKTIHRPIEKRYCDREYGSHAGSSTPKNAQLEKIFLGHFAS